MKLKTKARIGCVVLATLLAACGSSTSSDTTITSTTSTTVPAAILEKAEKLQLTQKWDGNSVTVVLTDSKGQNCIGLSALQGEECFGFYFGWSANFQDEDRSITYDSAHRQILSKLEVGDQGNFQLLYQESDNSENYLVREEPFAYNG